MARRSTLDDLPQEVLDWMMRLREQGRTYDEIVTALRGLDTLVVQPSRSAIHRYMQRAEKARDLVQRQRLVAEAMTSRDLGDVDDSQVARGNMIMMHAILTDIQMAALEAADGENADLRLGPQQAMQLAKALDHLAKAAKDSVATAVAIEERAARKARTQAAETAGVLARERGLSAADIEAIQRGIIGE